MQEKAANEGEEIRAPTKAYVDWLMTHRPNYAILLWSQKWRKRREKTNGPSLRNSES